MLFYKTSNRCAACTLTHQVNFFLVEVDVLQPISSYIYIGVKDLLFRPREEAVVFSVLRTSPWTFIRSSVYDFYSLIYVGFE